MSRPTRTVKQLHPNSSSKPSLPIANQQGGEPLGEDIINDHDSTPNPSSSELNSTTTESTSKVRKRKLGLSDILPEPGPPREPSLTLKDIVPSKKPKKALDAGAQRLKEFHNAFRAAFAPVHLNPDVLKYVTKRKQKVTLNHIVGKESYGPLYDIQDAIDKYMAERENQANEMADDKGLDSDNQAANLGVGEASGDEDGIKSLKSAFIQGNSGGIEHDGKGFSSWEDDREGGRS